MAGGTSAGAAGEPRIVIDTEVPLTVVGTSFAPRELVTVRAIGTFGTRSVRIRAAQRGTFRVRIRVSGSPCVLRRVSATGTRGSRAVLRLVPGVCPVE